MRKDTPTRSSLDKLIAQDDEKFGPVRQSNLDRKLPVELFMPRFVEMIQDKPIFVLTSGKQGSGKTTFVRKYFPEEVYFEIDDEDLTDEYVQTRTEKDKEWVMELGELCGLICDWRYYGIENWIHNKVTQFQEDNFSNSRPVVLDGIFPNKVTRSPYLRSAKEAGATYTCCFLFDVPICHAILRKDKSEGAHPLYQNRMRQFLNVFESPVNKHGSLEKGIDTVIVINQEDTITNIFYK